VLGVRRYGRGALRPPSERRRRHLTAYGREDAMSLSCARRKPVLPLAAGPVSRPAAMRAPAAWVNGFSFGLGDGSDGRAVGS
jgi:hypothetical protein